MARSTVFIGNDMILRLDELKDSAGAFVLDATVILESLEDSAGIAVVGVTTPLTLDFVAASNGRYEGTIPDTAVFVAGESYVGVVKATTTSNVIGRWRENIDALTREG